MPAEADPTAAAPPERAPRFGLLIEYALVDGESLDPAPAADELLGAAAVAAEHAERDPGWTHRLPRHVAALHDPVSAASPSARAAALQRRIVLADGALERSGLRLMPTGMHPWMNPARGPSMHEGDEASAALARVVDCKVHGIANSLGATLVLPFDGDEEFVRLHAAVRHLLPVLPGLAASSPLVGGEPNGVLDNRLEQHRAAWSSQPALAGQTVPEPVGSMEEYRDRVLEPLYAALAPHDPEGALRDERLNMRGAAALLDREVIEIRVLDAQEAPAMDVAYGSLVASVLQLLAAEQWADTRSLRTWRTESLAKLLERAARDAERAEIGDRRYLATFGLRAGSASLRSLWEHLAEQVDARVGLEERTGRAVEHYLRHGSLATRILATCGWLPSRGTIARTYERICESLAAGEAYAPAKKDRDRG